MRIGLKVGSNVLTDGNGKIHENIIKSICDQIAFLKEQGHEVFLVSSGAIACDSHKDRDRCVRASVGQLKLMRIYDRYLEKWGINLSQLLYVDFNLYSPYNKHTKFVLEEALRNDSILPIINANDPVDDFEAKALAECGDNDVLFKKTCLLVGADIAVIGFWEEGVYNSEGEIISMATPDNKEELLRCARGGSDLGHGKKGMATKVRCSFELAKNGVYVVLVPGYRSNFLIKAVNKTPEFGTVFH